MRNLLLILFLFIITDLSFAQIIVNDSTSIDSVNKFKDTLSVTDTTGLFTDSTFAKEDSLIPLHQLPVYENSITISRSFIKFDNFRYTEDIVDSYSFSFLQDKGSIGNPTNIYLFGAPYATYLIDNKPVSFSDLNNIQSEFIDSVEILPLPRNILFNSSPVVNFISKDFVPIRPYSRIKYYQGVNGEALFDGSFSSQLYKRLYGYLEVTNRKLDRSFINTSFNSWQAAARLKYLFSNDFNVNFSYLFSKSYKGLNGGVNIDSLISNGAFNEDMLYNEILAPVNFYNQDINQKFHSFDLNIRAVPLENFYTDASVYYHFSLEELNNINDLTENDFKYNLKTAGGMIRQYYYNPFFRFNVNFDYSYSEYKDGLIFYTNSNNRQSLGISGILDFTFIDLFKPSLFYKINRSKLSNSDFDNISSVGVDVVFNKYDFITLYSGYSLYDMNGSVRPFFQTYASFNYKDLYLKADFFNRTNVYAANNQNMSGFSGLLGYRYGSFFVEAKSTFYMADEIYNMPSKVLGAGIYFNDSLFRPNLLLKTGFKLNYIGSRIYQNGNTHNNLPGGFTLDFILSGEIRKVAVVYLTIENLLDRKYYITPYYPMYERNFRFGISWELFN